MPLGTAALDEVLEMLVKTSGRSTMPDEVEAAAACTYRCTFPREVSHQAALNFVRSLAALPLPSLDVPLRPVTFEVYGDRDGIRHHIHVPAGVTPRIETQLMTHVPGASVEEAERPAATWAFGVELALSHPYRPLRIGSPEAVVAGLLSCFGPFERKGDALLLQWMVASARPRPLPRQRSRRHGSLLLPGIEADARKDRKDKQKDHTFVASCRIVAAGPAARRAVWRVRRALESVRGPGVHFRNRWTSSRRVIAAVEERREPVLFGCHLSAPELTAVLGLPFGSPNVPGLSLGRSRQLYADSNIPSWGLVIATSNYPGSRRKLALDPAALTSHVHIHGKTNSGKSNVIVHLAVGQMKLGYGVAVIDPTGELMEDLAARIPAERLGDVVCFEPADTDYAVGFNIFSGSVSPEVVADQMMAIFHGIYHDTGIYANNYLRGAIQALASVPGMTLVDAPVFLTDLAFRQRVLAQVKDPIIKDIWVRFAAKSASDQRAMVAPAIHRIQPLLMRSSVRLSLGQAENQIDMARVLREGKILLVSLPKGLIGEETAKLYGSIIFARMWQAAQARPRGERRPFFLHVDEAHNFIHMPLSLDTVLAEARKFGLGLTLAHQGESQLPMAVREAIHTNTRTKISFTISASDAVSAAKEIGPPLTPTDLTQLGQWEIVLQTTTQNQTSAPATGKTLAPPPETSTPAAVRAASRSRWGRTAAAVDQEILARQRGTAKPPKIEFEE